MNGYPSRANGDELFMYLPSPDEQDIVITKEAVYIIALKVQKKTFD